MVGFAINPNLTTTAPGTFNVDSGGMIQGMSMDAPAIRNSLTGGVVAASETSPMYGGIAISEYIPTGFTLGSGAGPKAMGPFIGRATGVATAAPILGFTVFDQAHHMIAFPQSPVPLAPVGGSVNFYRLGSKDRLALAIDPALITLAGGLVSQQVSWDFFAQKIVPYVAAYGNVAVTAATYNAGTGQATYTTSAAHGLVAGNDLSINGITPIGYNGSFTALAGTTGSTIVVALPVNPGGSGTVFGAVVGGGGILPVRILKIDTTNCMTINVDPVTGFATWNRNGACAEVEL